VDRLYQIGNRGNAGGLAVLIQIKVGQARSWLTRVRQEPIMPVADALVLSVICVAFIGFV
jgi:hypothetical protein